MMNGRGCSESIERISRQFARAREVEETVVASGTSRFYQRRGAITSCIVVTHDEQIDPAVDPRLDEHGHFRREERQRGITPFKVLFPIGVVLFVGFWTWALFFASKTAVNKIEDTAWTERAEEICAPVKAELRSMELLANPSLEVRADLVTGSTDLLAAMLDDVEAVQPVDPKGQAIVPDWIADWRTLLQDRYNYAERLRDGQDVPFTETAVRNVPITERIETFAGDNDIPSCAPPRGSVL
jgi:hypothetical protein